MRQGQVFTRRSVADFMVSLLGEPGGPALEPCSGAGVFLDSLQAAGWRNVTGYEIDPDLCAPRPGARMVCSDFLAARAAPVYAAAVMNPPYIRQEDIGGKEALRADPLYGRLDARANLYMYFVIKALSLLRDGGILCAIIPDGWLGSRAGNSFRAAVSELAGIDRLIRVKGRPFEREAGTGAVIIRAVRGAQLPWPGEEILDADTGKLAAGEASVADALFRNPVRLGDLASVRRGFGTPCNRMYINPQVSEKDRAVRIISSPRQITGYSAEGARTDALLFPEDPPEEETLDYIRGWERKALSEGGPAGLSSRIARGGAWWRTPPPPAGGILFSYFVRSGMRFVRNRGMTPARANFYLISGEDEDLLFALLNSRCAYCELEACGKHLGQGLLKLQVYDLEALPLPDPALMAEAQKERLRALGRELERTGREELVDAVTEALEPCCLISAAEAGRRQARAVEARLSGRR